MVRSGVLKLVLASIMLGLTGVHGYPGTQTPPLKRWRWASCHRRASATYQLILQGGPFPYEKDGVVFGNQGGCCPVKSRGTTVNIRCQHPVLPTEGLVESSVADLRPRPMPVFIRPITMRVFAGSCPELNVYF